MSCRKSSLSQDVWHVNAVGGIKRTYCGYLTKLNFQSSDSTEPKIGLSDFFMVAETVGKAHKELLRDIRTYCGYLTERNFALTDFFIESTFST